MKRNIVILVVLAMMLAMSFAESIVVEPIPGLPLDFIRGADISMLSQIEECGGKYYDGNGREQDFLSILKDNGVNWIRLRLWHNPVNQTNIVEDGRVVSKRGEPAGGGNNDLERTIGMARRAKDAGFKLLLDLHYSDTWADPSQQRKPAAWRKYSFRDLKRAMYDYTADVMRQLQVAGVCPDMVQLGNELNNGMLWPDGKIWGESGEKVGGMDGFASLLEQGVKAVRKTAPKVKIVVHLADGGNNAMYRSIFDPLTKKGIDFDVIGISYYPYWHGSLDSLKTNISDLIVRYKKEVVVVETAYGFTEENADGQGNNFKVYRDDKYGYVPSVQGQATVVRDVMASVLEAGGEKALGVFYWEPGWIPVEGAGWRTGSGNGWENQAMFNYDGKVLESMGVFNRVYADVSPVIRPCSYEEPTVDVAVGESVVLPATVRVVFNDDSIVAEPVAWDEHVFSTETSGQAFRLNGRTKVSGFKVTAKVTVGKR